MADPSATDPVTPADRSPRSRRDGDPRLAIRFHDGESMRSRNVSGIVRAGRIDIPAPSMRLAADWARAIAIDLQLEPGDVEPLSLARARARWPDFRRCVQAASDWMGALGLHDVLSTSDIALMACRGARYHHDAAQYGDSVFCNLFLSDDRGLDVHFPVADRRIALTRGTVLIFDTGQPHAVVLRDRDHFDAADFASGQDRNQVFLTWELPVGDPRVTRALDIVLDAGSPAEAGAGAGSDEAGLWLDGAPARVCPASGRVLPDGGQAIT